MTTSRLAAAQPIQQRQGRREIGIDARAAGRPILSRKTLNRALQASVESTRRYHPSVVTPAASVSGWRSSAELRLPASAVASSSAPSSSQVPAKADADFMAAEHRVLAPCRRVLLVEDLALPAAVLRSVGAEIVEECVATEDAAVMSSITPVRPP